MEVRTFFCNKSTNYLVNNTVFSYFLLTYFFIYLFICLFILYLYLYIYNSKF